MHKRYIFIVFASLVFLGTVALTFSQIGSPMEIQGRNLDSTRISDFQNIFYAVQSYAGVNKKLPDGLSDLTYVNRTKDPQTGSVYGYKITGSNSFELCTDFATNSPAKPLYNYSPYNTPQYSKGYNCLKYHLDNLQPSNAAPQPPSATQPNASTSNIGQ